MTADEIRQRLFRVLRSVAPESQPEQLDPSRNYRDELDLDSVDYMNVMVGLNQAFGIDIPETDYRALETVDGAVAYFGRRLAPGA